MADGDGTDERRLFRPSSIPGEREYERAREEAKQLYGEPDPEAVSEEDHYRKKLFLAKSEVAEMIPRLLRQYEAVLQKEESERQNYSDKVYKLVLWWLGIILSIILLSNAGFKQSFFTPRFSIHFSLDPNIIIALITSATAGLIGLLATIISYFFTKSREQISLYDSLFKAMLSEKGHDDHSAR